LRARFEGELLNRSSLVEKVAAWLVEAKQGVAFTGAGISTESGIPDFRSPGGVWATNRPVYYDEFLASAEARFEYWRQKAITHRDFSVSPPNLGHRLLAKWQTEGRIASVLTQNIDGLHQLAGSTSVHELHGTARFVACLDCRARFEADAYVQAFEENQKVPDCPQCGGLLKHATISFGQMLDPDVLENCVRISRGADVFLAIGSSLVVHPAASLPMLAKKRGGRLVIINRDETPLDSLADVVINGEIGETLAAIEERMIRKG